MKLKNVSRRLEMVRDWKERCLNEEYFFGRHKFMFVYKLGWNYSLINSTFRKKRNEAVECAFRNEILNVSAINFLVCS